MAKHLKSGVTPQGAQGNGGGFPLNVAFKLVDYKEVTENNKGEKLPYPRPVFILEDKNGLKFEGSSGAFYCSFLADNGAYDYDALHYTDERYDDWFMFKADANEQVKQITGKAIELNPNGEEPNKSQYTRLSSNGKWYPYVRKPRIRIVKCDAPTQA
jgi:hypothetical protein